MTSSALTYQASTILYSYQTFNQKIQTTDASTSPPVSSRPEYNCKWYTPSPGLLKLNFDGSVVRNKHSATGFVFRDANYQVLLSSCAYLGNHSILMTEALALRAGLNAANIHGYRLKSIFVEGDSKCLIDVINGSSTIPWRVKNIVSDIQKLATLVDVRRFSHIHRQANFVADNLAKLGHDIGGHTWNVGLPLSCASTFQFDCLQSGCCRRFSL